MDIGTAFGGMGSSREMMIGALAEPVMLMAVFTLSMTANTTNLSEAVSYTLESGVVLRPSFIFAMLGLMMVAVAETGRVPVDNPATHLELTMVHEAMILEYSGRHLALIEWASKIKLMIYLVLIANIFLPWGIADNLNGPELAIGTVAIAAKLALLGLLLVVWETVMAKMRLFRVPQFLGFAFLLALLGIADAPWSWRPGADMEFASLNLFDQAVLFFAAFVLLTSFVMLAQARIVPLIHTFAWRARCSPWSRRWWRSRRIIRTCTSPPALPLYSRHC